MTYNVRKVASYEYQRYLQPTGEEICEKPRFSVKSTVWLTPSERAEKVDFGNDNCYIVSYNVER